MKKYFFSSPQTATMDTSTASTNYITVTTSASGIFKNHFSPSHKRLMFPPCAMHILN